MSKKEQKTRCTIEERQRNAHKAAVENAKQANNSIRSSQNWLLLLGLAELSFLGVLLLKDSLDYNCLIKILIIFLLSSFVSFIIGSILQYKHNLKWAREDKKISINALQYLEKGKKFVDEIPEELKLPEKQIVTSKITDYFIFISYVLVILVTLGIIFLVIVL